MHGNFLIKPGVYNLLWSHQIQLKNKRPRKKCGYRNGKKSRIGNGTSFDRQMGISRWNLVILPKVTEIKSKSKSLKCDSINVQNGKWKVIANYRLYTSEQSECSIYPTDLD